MASKGSKGKAIREFKSSGNKAMTSGAFQKAARQYTKALELDPGNAILYSNRSAAHFNLRQFAESLEDAESAILCDSMWWKAYKRKGLSLIHMQRYEEAITTLEEGLKIVKKNAEMEKNLEFARACQEQAQNLYILPEPHMMQRLESVPVFIVTDDVGQPFFITYEDGQQVCTFYFDKSDANSTLDWIKSENPDLGDTARVIHITLNQAFNLAQETQKQYYDETTRAAVEEDRRVAEGGDISKSVVVSDDVDGSDDDKDVVSAEAENNLDAKKSANEEANISKPSENTTQNENASKVEIAETDEEPKTGEVKDTTAKEGDVSKKDGNNSDDSIIDDNAPLSFQFRPELRQVQIAVELLNKNPNPPVRPILRDPRSVRKAKAEAVATSAVPTENKEGEDENDNDKERALGKESDTAVEIDVVKAGESDKTDVMADETNIEINNSSNDTGENADMEKSDDVKIDDTLKVGEINDDEELTVDNFNGIPIFQAKGLTLLQNNEQLIPLFFSKWDLEAAWKQLMQGNSGDVPTKCEVDVGTLEDVLRRMSESKTKEFESVFFVPSRESMKAIGAKFPLDDLTATRPVKKPPVRKAAFSKAKQIAARGGTKEEVRAAIREDLELAAERQRMAEIIAQIEQARRLGGISAAGLIPTDGRRRSGRIDRTMRRNAQRLAQKQAARSANRQANQRPAKSPTTGNDTAGSSSQVQQKTGSSSNKDSGNTQTGSPATTDVKVATASPVAPQDAAVTETKS